MLANILPLLESIGGGGTATSLGGGSGIGSTLGRLLGGSSVQAFGSQQELGGALRQISDLTANITAAREAMSSMKDEHEQLGVKAAEDERLYGFRSPIEQQRMADLQQQQIEHARQMQLQQDQMQALQARAAVSLDPSLAAQQTRQSTFRRAGALAIGGQAVQSLGPSFLRNLPGVSEASSLSTFAGGDTNGQIINNMGSTAANAVSNVAGAGMQGAAVGGLLGPGGAAIGGTLGTLAAVSKEAASLPLKMREWSTALVDSNRHLGRYSGEIAQANAMAGLSSQRRDILSARETGGSIAGLSRGLDGLSEEMRPFKDALTNTLATKLGDAISVMTALVPAIKELADVIPNIPMTPGGYTKMGMKMGARLGAGKSPFEESKPSQSTIEASASAGAAAAFRRMKAEDISKPRSVPKR